MASVGPNLCTSALEYGSGTSWSGITNTYTSDNSYASCMIVASSNTKGLLCNGFGFTIPQGAVIEGITVSIERASLNETFIDYDISLVKTGTTTVGSNLSAGATWSTTENSVSFGSSTTLWGTTWAPEELNASSFGVSIIANQSNSVGTDTAYVDTISCRIFFSGGAIPSLMGGD